MRLLGIHRDPPGNAERHAFADGKIACRGKPVESARKANSRIRGFRSRKPVRVVGCYLDGRYLDGRYLEKAIRILACSAAAESE